jgi:HAD superfamily hydrolase (TIGR01509 family)
VPSDAERRGPGACFYTPGMHQPTGEPGKRPRAGELPAAVLWDMDGTLVDTEPYWINGEHALVESYGGVWSEEYAHQLVGNDLMVSAQFIRDNSPVTLEPVQIIEELLDRVVHQVREHVPWRPGARELLSSLDDAGVPCALVTMSWRSLAAAVLESLPAGSFQAVITGDEVAHGKPHPEPYLAAARALGVSVADCVAIEDSPTGVRSAVAAGVPTLAVPHVVPVPVVRGSVQVPTLRGLSAHDLVPLFART